MWGFIHFCIILSTQAEHTSLLTGSHSSSLTCKWIKRSHSPIWLWMVTSMRGVYLHLPCQALDKPALMSNWRSEHFCFHHCYKPDLSFFFLMCICSLKTTEKSGGGSIWPHEVQNSIPVLRFLSGCSFILLLLFSLSSGFSTQKAKGSEVTITLLHFTWPTQRKAISRQMWKTQTLWKATGPLI